MKKAFITLFFVVSFASCFVYADNERDTRPKNNVNANLLGYASLVSFNYERVQLIHPNIITALKAGVGFNEDFNLFSVSQSYFTLPHHVTVNFGIGPHFIEIGAGGTVLYDPFKTAHYLYYPVIGYRLHPLYTMGINFRLFVHLPYALIATERLIVSPVGISLGRSF